MEQDPRSLDFAKLDDGIPCLTQRVLAPIGTWHLLVGCLLLNKTHRRQGRPALEAIFRAAPHPGLLAAVSDSALLPVLEPCGLVTRRIRALREMTAGLLAGTYPLKLPWLGPYAWDSHDIFVLGVVLNPEDVGDHSLKPYLEGVWAGRWPAPMGTSE